MEDKSDYLLHITGQEKSLAIPNAETDKLIEALYIFCLDNKIQATLTNK